MLSAVNGTFWCQLNEASVTNDKQSRSKERLIQNFWNGTGLPKGTRWWEQERGIQTWLRELSTQRLCRTLRREELLLLLKTANAAMNRHATNSHVELDQSDDQYQNVPLSCVRGRGRCLDAGHRRRSPWRRSSQDLTVRHSKIIGTRIAATVRQSEKTRRKTM